MALRPTATLTFSGYEVSDDGIIMRFVCLLPGPGEPTDYFILLSDVDLATVTTQLQLRTLVQSKLDRKLRAAGIASKLDGFIGQSLTV